MNTSANPVAVRMGVFDERALVNDDNCGQPRIFDLRGRGQNVLKTVVPRKGLEPSLPCGKRILS